MSSVAKNVQLNLGIVSCQVRVESAQFTEDYLVNVCTGTKQAHDPIAVTRPLTCPEGCEGMHPGLLKKAKQEGGGLVLLDDSEVASLNEDGKPFIGKIQLVPYNMDEVLAHTGNASKMYQLHPMKGAEENYALIRQVIACYPGKGFVARYSVRSKAQIYMATVNNGCVFLSERSFTERLKPIPNFDHPVNAAMVPLVIQMIEAMAVEFDPKTFTNSYNNALVEMTRSRQIIGGKVPTTAPVDEPIVADLVRQALMEYRLRKSAEVATDI